MKDLILKQFEKQNSRAGDILMMRNLNFSIIQKLNPKEKELFSSAINSLIDEGFITYEDGKNGIECLRLTEKGFENLYSNSLNVEQIKDLILKQFEKQNSRAGDILMMRNLNFSIIQKLNPKEKELFSSAVNSLIDEGFITYEDGKNGIECIRLTEKGYDNLY